MLALSMVVRNCAPTLRQILGCVAPYVDEIVIVLGGESADDTEAVAREFTEKVYPFEWVDDFAAARNFCLSQVTEPYWMWLDGDDISLTSAQSLPNLVESMEENGISCIWFPYVYQTDEFGNPTEMQVRERMFRRSDGWHWRGRVHEVVTTEKQGVPMLVYEGVSVLHSEKANKEDTSRIERNADLLRRATKEEPNDMRHVLALAHAEFGLKHYPDALGLYQRYYYAPQSRIEQWWAACQMARICITMHDFQGAKGWALAALQVDARYKDPYCLMAHGCWWGDQSADETLAWAIASLTREEAPLAICRFPREYTLNLQEVMHRAYAAKGDYVKAYETVAKAKEAEPVVHWDKFIRLYAEAIRVENSAQAALQLADHLTRRGDALRAKSLLEHCVPSNIRDLPNIVKARKELYTATAHAYEPSRYRSFYGDETVLHDCVGTEIDPFRWRWVYDRLERSGAKTILDVGCANGAPALELARRGYEVTGIDIHARNLERAAKKAEEEGLSCRFEVGDLEDYYRRVTENGNFTRFDVVLMAELLEHLPPHMVNHYLLRADALGERVLFTTPCPLSGDWPGLGETGTTVLAVGGPREHLAEFRQDELEHLMIADGRRPVELYAITQPWDEGVDVQDRTWVGEYDHDESNDLPVVFYLGEGVEPWTPAAIDNRGLGGSETATVRMAQEFAKRGHRAIVYADCEGVYDGVVYRNYTKFSPEQKPWLLVLSRQPAALTADMQAFQTWLWCHDIHYGQQEALNKADRILTLSEWHRQDWTKRYGDHLGLTVTGNGILPPVAQLQEPVDHRFIYASSPDRGLDVLLEWWPDIRKMWSDAELHIFYGFDVMRAVADRLPHLRAFTMRIEALIQQEGVIWEGRVPQPQLYEEFAKSQFWLYPSIGPGGEDWYETYCITALEAQANGCIPITRPVGALSERIVLPERCLIDSRDPKKFMKALRWWDQQPQRNRNALRWRMSEYARGHTWDKVAEQWLGMAKVPSLVS